MTLTARSALVFDLFDLACMDCDTVFTGRFLPGSDFDTSACPCCGAANATWEPWTLDADFEHDHRLPGDRVELPHSVRVFPFFAPGGR